MRSSLKLMMIFFICMIYFQSTCSANTQRNRTRSASNKQRHLQQPEKESVFERQLAIKSAWYQAITLLNNQQSKCKRDENQKDDTVEVKQTGSITKVNLSQGTINLADFVLEKQTRQDKNQQLFQGFFSIYRVGHLWNLFNDADGTQLEVVSAEHGQVIFKNNLSDQGIKIDEQGFQAHVFGNPYNPTGDVSAVIFTKHDNTIHSLKLSLQNSTSQDVRVLGTKKIEAKPQNIMSIKSRGMNKVMILLKGNKIEIYDDKMKKMESKPEGTATFTESDSSIIAVHQQPLALVFHTKREIAFYRLGRYEMLKSKNNCISRLIDIDQVIFDSAQPSVMIALSRSQNMIQIFQAGGRGDASGCRTRGVIRFDDAIKQQMGSTRIKSVVLQPANHLVYITFENSDKFAVLTYTPQQLAESLLSQTANNILRTSLHSFQSLPDNHNFEILTADTNIIVRSQNQSFVFGNSFTSGKLEKQVAKETESGQSVFTPELLQKLMFPIAIVTVGVYQLYCKPGKKKVESGPGTGQSRASKSREIEQRMSSLTNSMEPDVEQTDSDQDTQINSSSKRNQRRRPGGRKVQFGDDDVY